MPKSLPTISPTACKQTIACPRARAFRSVEKIKPPEMFTEARDQGTRMHGHLETAKLTGKLPPQDDPEARVASAAIGYWPPETVQWCPEVEIYVDRGDFAYKGKSDQLGPGFVGDYKVTGDRKNLPDGVPYWVKDFEPRRMRGVKDEIVIEEAKAVLLSDPQWLIYGKASVSGAALLYHDESDSYYTGKYDEQASMAGVELVAELAAESVLGQWTYIIKPPKLEGEPKILPVNFDASPEEIEEKLLELDEIARIAIAIQECYTKANDVPHKAASACGGIGMRCDYSAHCDILNPGSWDPIKERKEINMASLAALMEESGLKAKAETPKEEPKAETPKAEPTAETSPVDEVLADVMKVNPPESEGVDVMASEEEIEEKTTRGRKKKTSKKTVVTESDAKAAAPEFVEALVCSAEVSTQDEPHKIVASILVEAQEFPVGARLRIEVIK